MQPAGGSPSTRSLARSLLPEAGNLFRLPDTLPAEELVERLAGGEGALVERIVSTGQATPPGEWLAGERDEWVALLQGEAELSFADGSRTRLEPGDYVLIRAGERHRVERTSSEPPCVWLAVQLTRLTAATGARASARPYGKRRGPGRSGTSRPSSFRCRATIS